jgi:putative nucleotidyltransferase with HDIG domain
MEVFECEAHYETFKEVRGMVTREQAWVLLKEFVVTDSLRKHALAVEAAMRGYAKRLGENEEVWASLGLLHDLDYEKYPEKHPYVAVDLLEHRNFPDEFVLAVKGHADYTDTPRESLMAKMLYACDELSSFIVAVALVRPNGFEGLEAKSVRKKLKDKAFARAVNRDEIARGAEEIGVDLMVHIETVIDALRSREEALQAEGLSLL